MGNAILLCTYFDILCGFFIKKYEMGGACNKYVGEECRIQGFGGEN